jgi:formylglycine-generating enzyme required for sulfatase activity
MGQVANCTVEPSVAGYLSKRMHAFGFQLMRVVDREAKGCLLVEPPMVYVPSGPFLMGSDKRLDTHARTDELPQHIVALDAFEIATFTVTVAEYKLFIDGTGHHVPREANLLTWKMQIEQRFDHPVLNVCLEDALRYVQWLAQLTGRPYRMPTEAQWEKAARGCDGRIYPWGNEPDMQRANTAETDPRFLRTKPIGSHPNGASPYGAQDMAGNVLEWTSSAYRNYPYDPHDGREDLSPRPVVHGGGRFDNRSPYVLRGGSIDNTLTLARAAFRMPSDFPDWVGQHGFRITRTGDAG